jgi:DNA-binding MarR family transcriptional regulator
MNTKENRIMGWLDTNPGSTSLFLAQATGDTVANVVKILNQLEKAGKVRSEGSVSKKWFWK